MTSKNLFFKLMREDLKRRLWAVCLAFLTFFFWMPVAAAMGISDLARRVLRWQMNGTTFENTTIELERLGHLTDLVKDVVVGNPLTAMTIVCAAVILGLTGFSYLHNKSKVDFYNSAPVRRELLFLVKFVDGILIVFSMYFLNMVIACGLFAANGVFFGSALLPAVVMMLVNLTGFLLFYTLTIIAVLMTGNFIISVLGMIVFFTYAPFFEALLMILAEMFFMTNNISGNFWNDLMMHGSPVPYYISLLSCSWNLELGQMYQVLPMLILPLAVSVLLLFFCLFLYRTRPSESAGKAMAFRISKAPIKFLLVVPVTIYMSLFFWSIYSSLGWGVFGFLFGLVVTHCVIEIIYHFDFRKLFANRLHMVLCGVLALAMIGVYRFDLVGYDRYLPSGEKFVSAGLEAYGLKDWNSAGYPVKDNGILRAWEYLGEETYVRDHMAVTDYETVRALAESGIAAAAEERKKRFTPGGFEDDSRYDGYGASDEDSTGYPLSVLVTYRLKSGRTVCRYYDVDVMELRDVFDRLYESAEYKNGVYPILSQNAGNLAGIYSLKNNEIREVKADKALAAETLQTYQEELTKLTLAQRQKETPVAALRFLTEEEREYLKYVSSDYAKNYTGDFRLEDMQQVNFYPVYPSFTKTIELLKSAGSDVTAKPDVDDIDYVKIRSRYWEGSERSYNETGAGGVITIRNDGEQNREAIEKLLGSLVDDDCVAMNDLQIYDVNFSVEVYLKSANAGREDDDKVYLSYQFDGGEVPEFLREALHYDEIDETARRRMVHYGLNGMPQ